MLGVWLGDVDDQEVREQELGQRVCPVPLGEPVHLTIEAIPESEVGVEPGAIRPLLGLSEVKCVLGVVQVADLQVAVHRVELLRRQHQVGYLGPPGAL